MMQILDVVHHIVMILLFLLSVLSWCECTNIIKMIFNILFGYNFGYNLIDKGLITIFKWIYTPTVIMSWFANNYAFKLQIFVFMCLATFYGLWLIRKRQIEKREKELMEFP